MPARVRIPRTRFGSAPGYLFPTRNLAKRSAGPEFARSFAWPSPAKTTLHLPPQSNSALGIWEIIPSAHPQKGTHQRKPITSLPDKVTNVLRTPGATGTLGSMDIHRK